jgi:hypothetical protein
MGNNLFPIFLFVFKKIACRIAVPKPPNPIIPMPAQSSSLIDQLFRTVETIGVEQTEKILQEAQFRGIVFANKHVEFVVKTVAKGFEIPVHEIYYGNGRKNDRKWAIGFCVHYLSLEFKYSTEEIAEFINKDFSSCHKYGNLIKTINPKNMAETKFYELKQQFDIQIQKTKLK